MAGRLPEAEIEALESHYLTCARCQTELRLAAAIRDVLPEVEELSGASDRRTPAVTGRGMGRRIKVGAVAAALAAALAGVLLVPDWRNESLRHGEAGPEAEVVPRTDEPSGEVEAIDELRWRALAAADLYQVTLYDAAGNVIWEADTQETHVALPDSVQLEPGALYLWQVAARVGWDRWVSSELARFRVAAR